MSGQELEIASEAAVAVALRPAGKLSSQARTGKPRPGGGL